MRKLLDAFNILGENWRPQAQDGALNVLENCRDGWEAAYLLGAAFQLERLGGMPVILGTGEADGQPGLRFFDPWMVWKLPGKTAMSAPSAMLIVPQCKASREQPHTFGVFYGDDDESDPPRWRLQYMIDLSAEGSIVVTHRGRMWRSVGSPSGWFRAILRLEVAACR